MRDPVVQISETDVESEVGFLNAEGPPVPIPNTEVKLRRAEDTLPETVRENRSMPTFSERQSYGTVSRGKTEIWAPMGV